MQEFSRQFDSMANADLPDKLEGHNQSQAEMMDEQCILVGSDDQVIGSMSKVECTLDRAIDIGHSASFYSIPTDVCWSKEDLLKRSHFPVSGPIPAVVTPWISLVRIPTPSKGLSRQPVESLNRSSA